MGWPLHSDPPEHRRNGSAKPLVTVIHFPYDVLQQTEVPVPEVRPEGIEWDDVNLRHATAHGVGAAEIEQVIANGPRYRRNRRGRSADYLATGLTDGGRRVVVAVEWRATTRLVRPITAWEE